MRERSEVAQTLDLNLDFRGECQAPGPDAVVVDFDQVPVARQIQCSGEQFTGNRFVAGDLLS